MTMDFYATKMGRQFYQVTMPTVAKGLTRLAEAVEKNNELLEDKTASKVMENLPDCKKIALMHTLAEEVLANATDDMTDEENEMLDEIANFVNAYNNL